MNRMIACAIFSSWMYLAGCGGNEPAANAPPPPSAPPPSSETTTQNTTVTPAAMPTTSPSEAPPAAPMDTPAAPAASAPALTDDEILHVLHTANAGEIEQAKLAQQKAKNARVKQFASMMVKDHSEADKKGNDAAKKAKASPSPSEVSKNLESDAKQMTSTMSGQKGSDFDRSYMDAQVKEHQAVLDLIDKQLTPNAKSSEVKAILQTIRPKVEGHLKQAQAIQKGL